MDQYDENFDRQDDYYDYDATPLYTQQVFNSRDELMEWAQTTAMTLGFVLVTKRSIKNSHGEFTKTTLMCDRGGVYKGKGSSSSRATGTHRCNCPFELEAYFMAHCGWRIYVIDHRHNHQPALEFEGHPFARRMSQAEKAFVMKAWKLNLEPRDILKNLKQEFPNNLSIIKDIYNTIGAMKHDERKQVGHTPMQVLMGMLFQRNYTYDFTTDADNSRLENMFFMHPKSFELFRAFPHVLFIDATYKTNTFNMPFVQIVGVTSTGMTFRIAAAFMIDETGYTYRWVLQKLRETLIDDTLVRTIVTDKEKALINACKEVFPTAKRILCRFHIRQNLERNCEKDINNKKAYDSFIGKWQKVVQSHTFDEYLTNKSKLEHYLDRYPGIFNYLEDTWLSDEFRESIVSYWVDSYLNFANYTTNRVESEHALLKSNLNGRADMPRFLECTEDILNGQLTHIKASFEVSRINRKHGHNLHILRLLHGFVSHKALKIIVAEHQRLDDLGGDLSRCGCKVFSSCGIPCACRLSVYLKNGRSIPLDAIHGFWKKLDFSPVTSVVLEEADDLTVEEDLDSFKQAIKKQPLTVQRSWLKKILDIFKPGKTELKEPAVLKNTRGRPTKKQGREKSQMPDLNQPPPRKSSYQPSPKHQRSSSIVSYGQDDTNKDTGRHSSYHGSLQRSSSMVDYGDGYTNYDAARHNSYQGSLQRSSSFASYGFEQGSTTAFDPVWQSAPAPVVPFSNRAYTMRHDIPYINQIPKLFHEYVRRIVDVDGDGNCGFRAFAAAMGMNHKERFEWVRQQMVLEYDANKMFYEDIFSAGDHIEESLKVSAPNGRAYRDWMSWPEGGIIFANRFQCIVHCLGMRECTTVFPFFISQAACLPHRAYTVAIVGDNHFVMVELTGNYPMPPISFHWTLRRQEVAAGWEDVYRDRLQRYSELTYQPPRYMDITSDGSQSFWPFN